MKYTITHVAEWVLLAILAILCIYTAYKSYQIKEKVEYITVQDTIKICDTITEWKPYDVYHYRTDTAYLPIIDEKFDTIEVAQLLNTTANPESYNDIKNRFSFSRGTD